jgi:hypothetical protein
MEKPIFDLLLEISKLDFYNNEYKSNRTRDIIIARDKKQIKLDYLLRQGFTTRTENIYVITEYGYQVSKFNSWKNYLKHNKELIDRKIEKEKLDFRISWFQAKTVWLPYLFSMIGIVISIWAFVESKSNNPTNKHEQQLIKEHKQLPSKDYPTKDILNEKEKSIDSLNVGNQ